MQQADRQVAATAGIHSDDCRQRGRSGRTEACAGTQELFHIRPLSL